MSYSLNSLMEGLQVMIQGGMIRLIKGDTRSLDYSVCTYIYISICIYNSFHK